MARRLRPLLRDLVGDLMHSTGVTRPGAADRGRLTIVTLHRVLPQELRAEYTQPGLVVTPEELEWLLTQLTRDFECLPLAEAHRRWQAGDSGARPLLSVTFDDGQLDNFVYARPVLQAAGVRASFFIPVEAVQEGRLLWHDRLGHAASRLLQAQPQVANRLLAELSGAPTALGEAIEAAKALSAADREAYITRLEQALGAPAAPEWDAMMTWAQVGQLAAQGHEIGSHSMSHAILPLCSTEQIAHEVGESKRAIEDALQRPVETFCYPNGDSDPRVMQAVRVAGYCCAVTTVWGVNSPDAPRFALARCDIQSAHLRSRRGKLSPARLAWRLSPVLSELR